MIPRFRAFILISSVWFWTGIYGPKPVGPPNRTRIEKMRILRMNRIRTNKIWKISDELAVHGLRTPGNFWNGHNLWSARLCKMPHVPIDSEWPKIMFYISPQLQRTPALYSLEKIFETVNQPSHDGIQLWGPFKWNTHFWIVTFLVSMYVNTSVRISL